MGRGEGGVVLAGIEMDEGISENERRSLFRSALEFLREIFMGIVMPGQEWRELEDGGYAADKYGEKKKQCVNFLWVRYCRNTLALSFAATERERGRIVAEDEPVIDTDPSKILPEVTISKPYEVVETYSRLHNHGFSVLVNRPYRFKVIV